MWVLVGGGVVQAVVARRRVRVRVFVFIGAARFVVIWGNCSSSGSWVCEEAFPPLPSPAPRPGPSQSSGRSSGEAVLRLFRFRPARGEGVRLCGGDGLCAYKNPGAWPGFLLGGW